MPDADEKIQEQPRMKRTRLRRVRIIGLCLLGGAVINVLVAWSCAVVFDVRMKNRIRNPTTPAPWLGKAITNAGVAPSREDNWSIGTMTETFGCTHIFFYEHPEIQFLTDTETPEFRNEALIAARDQLPYWSRVLSLNAVKRVEVGCGWPLESLRSLSSRTHTQSAESFTAGALSLGDDWSLPFAVIAPGFLANAVFYGSVPYLLLILVECRRRQRHRKLGLCPSCAYDLRGAKHDVCPECGKAVG